MKKDILKNVFFIFFVSIALLIFFSNNKVKATEKTTSEEFFDSDEVILEYDAKTNTTKEINMQELVAKLKGKKFIEQAEVYQPEISMLASESTRKITNPTVAPYKMTCKVTFKTKNGTASGSAALVAPNLALTAAHCVFDKSNNFEKYSNWKAYPAYNNGSAYKNLSAGWDKVYYSKKWKETSGDYKYDWALCVLQANLGDSVGYHKVATYNSNDSMKNLSVNLLGYPKEELFDGKNQYESRGTITSVSSETFRASCWSVAGFSGGPVIRTSDNKIVGVASRNRTSWLCACKNYAKYDKYYK